MHMTLDRELLLKQCTVFVKELKSNPLNFRLIFQPSSNDSFKKPKNMVLTTPSGDEPIKTEGYSPFQKTLVFHFESILAAVKMCKKGGEAPQNHDFKFSVPLPNKDILTIYIQMRENYKQLLDTLTNSN
jgi:ATP-dependent phosphoenolpyruvate carboxykinase